MNRIYFQMPKWKLIVVLSVFYLIFEIFYVFKVVYFLSLSGKDLPLYGLGAYFIDWILVTVYMVLISIHTGYLLEKEVPWKKIIPIHIFFSVFISVVIRLVIDFYQSAVGIIDLSQYTLKNFLTGIVHSLDVNYLIYSAMIFIIYAFYYLEQVKLSNKQKGILEAQLLDTRIKMLTTQLQPHFLFNTLNSISSLIDINKEKAQDTLADLSDFLRRILNHMDSNFVTITKELQILNPYLNILRTRFQEKIEIKVTVQEELLEAEIPNLILQPLVENAVKHGRLTSQGLLLISLQVYSNSNFLIIEVWNSGSLKENEGRRTGLGLKNLRNRLHSIYGERASFLIEEVEEKEMVKCQLILPQ